MEEEGQKPEACVIKDLAELKKLLSLCRKQGVKDIKLGEVTITFGDMPRKQADDDEDSDIPTDEPTMEQLMFLSAGGIPPP